MIVTNVILHVIRGLNTIHLMHKKLHYKNVFAVVADDKYWLLKSELVSDKFEGLLEACLFP